MKVILAGMSKTGTKSMVIALKKLGMNVYDFLEHYQYHGNDWIRICEEGGTIDDFRRMYKDVDAVTDLPTWYFWEELHQAYPEAKIILTMRESEEDWIQSLKAQQNKLKNVIITLMRYLSPSYRRFYHYGATIGLAAYGVRNRSYFRINDINELLCLMTYRRHNSYVLEKAPKDKLLVFNVKDGWEPLCKFLGVDIPKSPFPHKNVRGNIYDEMMAKNPFFIRMQRELMLSLSLVGVLTTYGLYKLIRYSSAGWLSIGIKSARSVVDRIVFRK
ncbi:unnamed protein product [Clavelina lepadiformis]|uniref:Sulfotransferase family protein n=1 Tax=Clavelina lepadiformis TaxID=159417 RepID=A0ABP0FD90_CLALP